MWREALTPTGNRWIFSLSAAFFGIRFLSATQGHFAIIGTPLSVLLWGLATLASLSVAIFYGNGALRIICASVVISVLMLWSYLVLLLDSPTRFGTAATSLLLAVYVAFSWGRKPPTAAYPHAR